VEKGVVDDCGRTLVGGEDRRYARPGARVVP